MTTPEIQGLCSPGFERVREAFAKNFEVENEVGASFAATVNGRWVVDLWGGHADAAQTRTWEKDTIANVFSTTKAMTAVCAHMLVDRGLLDVEDPVAKYWPEFAQAGKETMPVKWILSHQAGLAGLSEPLPAEALYDWDRMVKALAAQAPLWAPGTRSGYHALTIGYLVGEIVRRITGKSLGTFFRDEVAAPLGADFWIGLPESEDGRVAEMIPGPEQPPPPPPVDEAQAVLRRALGTPALKMGAANTRAWRAAEIPAANGHGNARSCARVMAALACGGSLDGVRLMSEETLTSAIQEQIYGKDIVLGPMRWGLGFMLASNEMPLSPNPRTFGHGGAGGSFALADMDAKVGLAYVMNRMSPGTVGDKRLGRLIRAVYGAL
jgi:CubicO group peptidase (beta-lactamase class C family)